jgi:protease-4
MKILSYSPFVPLDDKLKAVTLEGVEHIYKTFVTHVAEGRKMTSRKWTLLHREEYGQDQRLKLGLVDRIGSLDDAINEAAISKSKTYKTQNYPEYGLK